MSPDPQLRPTPRPPRWMPIGGESEVCPAGEWWDAIRVPEAIGRRAVELLEQAKQPVGPVMIDTEALDPRLYFFVLPGSATGWNVPGTVVLGRRCHVVAPPADRTSPPGAHWYRLPVTPRALARPDSLQRVLTKARRERRGPAESPSPSP